MLSGGDAVEAGDRQVPSHRQAALAGGLHPAQGHHVVAEDDGGGPQARVEEPSYRLGSRLASQVALGDHPVGDTEPVTAHRLGEAAEAVPGESQVVGAGDEGDTAMPEGDQVVDQQPQAGHRILVDEGKTHFGAGPAEGDEGEAAFLQQAHPLVLPAEAQENDPVHQTSPHHPQIGLVLLGRAGGVGGEEDVTVVGGRFLADAGQELAEERLPEPGPVGGEDQPDHVGPSPAEPLGRDVGHVFEAPGGVLHDAPGHGGHVVETAQCPRGGGDRDLRLTGDVYQPGSHRARILSKTFWRGGEKRRISGRQARIGLMDLDPSLGNPSPSRSGGGSVSVGHPTPGAHPRLEVTHLLGLGERLGAVPGAELDDGR